MWSFWSVRSRVQAWANRCLLRYPQAANLTTFSCFWVDAAFSVWEQVPTKGNSRQEGRHHRKLSRRSSRLSASSCFFNDLWTQLLIIPQDVVILFKFFEGTAVLQARMGGGGGSSAPYRLTLAVVISETGDKHYFPSNSPIMSVLPHGWLSKAITEPLRPAEDLCVDEGRGGGGFRLSVRAFESSEARGWVTYGLCQKA